MRRWVSPTPFRHRIRLAHATADIGAILRRIIQDEQIHAVQSESIWLSEWTLSLPIFRVIDCLDIEAVKFARLAVLETRFGARLGARLESWKIARYESRRLGLFDRVLVTSEVDRRIAARSIEHGRIQVVPNGVDPHYFEPMAVPVSPDLWVFPAAFEYQANLDAADYLLREIHPRLRSLRPAATGLLLGDCSSEFFRMVAIRKDGVTATGYLPDIRRHLAEAAVVVVPLRAGGGTRLKILEAMSLGKCVVSTSIGAEGLEVIDGKHLILADDPDIFAQRVAEVMANPSLASEMGAVARQHVVRHYDWDRIGGELADWYARVLTT